MRTKELKVGELCATELGMNLYSTESLTRRIAHLAKNEIVIVLDVSFVYSEATVLTRFGVGRVLIPSALQHITRLCNENRKC